MAEETTLAIRDAGQLATLGDGALTVEKLVQTRELIVSAMSKAMKEGVHYGKIPGCGDKPTLLQPGAQLLCTLFRLYPEYEVHRHELPDYHVQIRVTSRLYFIGSQPPVKISEGVGECSSRESKHRFRKAAATVIGTGHAVPPMFWKKKETDGLDGARQWLATAYDGKNVGAKKYDDGWHVVIYTGDGGERVEHENPPDVHNTILKIAKKRAYVDATITATASSDFFTQDLEDIAANLAAHREKASTVSDVVEIEANPVERPAAAAKLDFRETRIHFGKNRGLMLSELSPQQVHWYENDWMPKKEVNGPTSVEDFALIDALKRYRDWRSSPRTAAPAASQTAKETPAGSTEPKGKTTAKKPLGLNWRTAKVHFGKKGGPLRDKMLGELTAERLDYLRKSYDEKDDKKLSPADKKLKAALALEYAERPSSAPVEQSSADSSAPPAAPAFNGPNHKALAESLDFAGLSQSDFMACAAAHGWIPKTATNFALMSDETASKFVDDFAAVQTGVRVFIEQSVQPEQ